MRTLLFLFAFLIVQARAEEKHLSFLALIESSGMQVSQTPAVAPFGEKIILLEIKDKTGKEVLSAEYYSTPHTEMLGNLRSKNSKSAVEVLGRLLSGTALETKQQVAKDVFAYALSTGLSFSIRPERPLSKMSFIFSPQAKNLIATGKEMKERNWNSGKEVEVPIYEIQVDAKKNEIWVLNAKTSAIATEGGVYASLDFSHGLAVGLEPGKGTPVIRVQEFTKRLLVDSQDPKSKNFMEFATTTLKGLRPEAKSYEIQFDGNKKNFAPITASFSEKCDATVNGTTATSQLQDKLKELSN